MYDWRLVVVDLFLNEIFGSGLLIIIILPQPKDHEVKVSNFIFPYYINLHVIPKSVTTVILDIG